jgi:lysophospholipase L1-like esterase
MSTLDIRVCFMGDSFTLGTGDPEGLGWPGRVFAAERGRGVNLTAYNLGIRGNTSAQMAERAAAEISARIADRGERKGVVITCGSNDVFLGRPLEESVQALRGMLQWARSEGYGALVVSPPCMADPAHEAKRIELQKAQGQVCADLATPMLDLTAAVADWSAWRSEAKTGDGVHPGPEGYRRVAAAFLVWTAWRDWLDGR